MQKFFNLFILHAKYRTIGDWFRWWALFWNRFWLFGFWLLLISWCRICLVIIINETNKIVNENFVKFLSIVCKFLNWIKNSFLIWRTILPSRICNLTSTFLTDIVLATLLFRISRLIFPFLNISKLLIIIFNFFNSWFFTLNALFVMREDNTDVVFCPNFFIENL